MLDPLRKPPQTLPKNSPPRGKESLGEAGMAPMEISAALAQGEAGNEMHARNKKRRRGSAPPTKSSASFEVLPREARRSGALQLPRPSAPAPSSSVEPHPAASRGFAAHGMKARDRSDGGPHKGGKGAL